MTVHSWAAMISIFTIWPILVWQFAGMALNAGWAKRGVIRDLFNEIRPFYLTLVAVHYCAEVVADGHVVNVWAGVGFGIQILNWFLFRNSGGDDDRWKRRGRRVAEKVTQVGSRLTVVPAGAPS